jgi:hypothetical protein
MSTTLVSPAAPKETFPAERTRWRLIPAFETNPALVRRAQTVPGKLTMLVIFAGMLRLQTPDWLAMSALLLLIAFLPEYRRALIACGTVYWLIFHNSWLDWTLVRKIAQREGAVINLTG